VNLDRKQLPYFITAELRNVGPRYRPLLRPRQGSMFTTLRRGAEAEIQRYLPEDGGQDPKTLRRGTKQSREARDKQTLRFKPAETLRTYLTGPEQKSLLTFLRRPGVPPTNNHAEQSLRHLVIFRKICFGTRSDSGLKTHSILPSLVQTARRQGVHPREFLQTLLTADTPTAQAALYNNSS